jgi:hypothetical protein
MEDAKGKAAQILDPLLSHFCTIEDQQLRAVSYFYDSGLLEAIILDFISERVNDIETPLIRI